MLDRLKNYTAKVANSNTFVYIVMPLIALSIFIFALILLVSLLDDKDQVARCKSLDGEYGRGKCFIKGEER